MATTLSHLHHRHHHPQQQQLGFIGTAGSSGVSSSPLSSSPPTPSPLGENFCKECGVMFESNTSLEVHLSYHRANLLSRWASQDPNSNLPPPPSLGSNNNMDSKFQPKQESQPSPQHQPPSIGPPSVSPYYQHQIDSSHAHVQYSMLPHYHESNGSGDQVAHFSPGQRQHLYTPEASGALQQYEGRQTTEPPRDSVGKERSASTPEEILDLDSNKVHIYNLPHHQQLQYVHANSFYRPYLMTQALPPPTNGNHPSHHNLPPPPPFPQESHPHHLGHIYRSNSPPSRSPQMGMMSPYEFSHGHHQYPPPSPLPPPPEQHQPPLINYQQPPPITIGPVTNFRGSFPSPQQPLPSGPPMSRRSPDVDDHSPTLPSSASGKKGKKSKMSSGGVNGNSDESSVAPKTKGWKGGECKRPKTYNCIACNKWFTSSGHLKRHYGTTLHKNSLRQKGENPDDHPQVIGKKNKEIHSIGKRSPGEDCNGSIGGDSTNPLESSSRSLNMNSGPSISMIKLDDSPTGKSTPIFNSGNVRGHPDFSHVQHIPSSPGPSSSPYPNNPSTPQPPPPTYLPIYHNGPQGTTQQPPYPMTMGIPPHAQFHPGPVMGYDNVYAVSVPSSMYNGAYPPSLMNGSEIGGSQLPPFSTVLSPYDQQFTSHHHHSTMIPSNAPIYLHHGNIGPPPGSPGSMTYDSESGIHSNSTTDGNNGHLNGESPEAARSASTASGLEISDDGELMSDDGQNNNGSGSTGFSSGSSDSELSHMTTPTPSVPSEQQVIKCPNCSKTFNRTCYLTQHTNSSHSGGKPFKCPTCGKRFPEAPALSHHVAKHGNNKPYKCDLCPKQFNHKTDLRRHLCLHTGEKPFVCSICGKGFIRKDHMTKHSETHRKVKSNLPH